MNRLCAICGCAVDNPEDVFCHECWDDLSAVGCKARQGLDTAKADDDLIVTVEVGFGDNPRPRLPPPTFEYRNAGPSPYRAGMALLVSACISAGFIAGFLVRGM